MMVSASALVLLSSCVSQKKYAALEAKQKETQDMLNTATVKLNACLAQSETMKEQITDLRSANNNLINTQGNLTTLSAKGAENLEKSLEQMKEKDLQIKAFRDAMNRKDSVTLALVTSLKGAIGNLNDEDIEINVEKGVVYVSISDKLLFNSGRWDVTNRAKEVLGKVAEVVNNKPEIEFMVEGHTDNVPIRSKKFPSNWELSAARATSIASLLINRIKYPEKSISVNGYADTRPKVSYKDSAGSPLKGNDLRKARKINRRVEIVLTTPPKSMEESTLLFGEKN